MENLTKLFEIGLSKTIGQEFDQQIADRIRVPQAFALDNFNWLLADGQLLCLTDCRFAHSRIPSVFGSTAYRAVEHQRNP